MIRSDPFSIERLLGDLIDSIREEQLAAIGSVLDDGQRAALMTLVKHCARREPTHEERV